MGSRVVRSVPIVGIKAREVGVLVDQSGNEPLLSNRCVRPRVLLRRKRFGALMERRVILFRLQRWADGALFCIICICSSMLTAAVLCTFGLDRPFIGSCSDPRAAQRPSILDSERRLFQRRLLWRTRWPGGLEEIKEGR